MSFAQIAKELRTAKGLSQMQLSKNIGISAAGIGYLELGKREPTSPTLIAYSKYFEVSADYLLGLEDDFGVRTAIPENDGLTYEERSLINQYRSLPEKIKKTIREQIEVYSEPNELLPKTDKKI